MQTEIFNLIIPTSYRLKGSLKDSDVLEYLTTSEAAVPLLFVLTLQGGVPHKITGHVFVIISTISV